MIKNRRLAAVAMLALTLGACAGPAIPYATPPKSPSSTAPVASPRPVQNNSLIGRNANAALGLFGKPRLDVAEGSGRKLQFAGTPCILDVYYYAPKQGADPLATHVDARTPDGRDANVPSCIEALRR
ncbi:hypothetical protein [Sphingopyxis sp. H115]|uniref:hypothetical protein n=1 Tax=Sphingopyxis sp. H115 TaxID=1759073 RepID=UPI000736723F|nr:hypothetical protein [Sphingopyxis sp. H115]KTE06825.1 hypothetical protein ATE71_16050 [Sphingopyxis sp. H115]